MLAWKIVGLDDPLVQARLAARETVMLHADSRFTRGTHFRHYRDAGGVYIRMAKRGQCKRYLTGCEITWIDGDPSLFQFRT